MKRMRTMTQWAVFSVLSVGIAISAAGAGSVEAVAPAPPADGVDTAAVAPDPEEYASATPSYTDAQEIADLVNQHRRANGLNPLIFDVDFSARIEPFAMRLAVKFPPPVPEPGWSFQCPKAGYDEGFRHDSQTAIDASAPTGSTATAENLAFRCNSANFEEKLQSAFGDLTRSAPHNYNMLNPIFTHIGVSVVRYGRSTFVVQRFARAPVVSKPATVRAQASCLSDKGRIDIDVTNPNATTTRYSVRVTGPKGFDTTRNLSVSGAGKGRVTITGRFDGSHKISVRPQADPEATPSTAWSTIDCAPADATRPVVVTVSCLKNNGRIDVDVANTTRSKKTYVVDVQSGRVKDRDLAVAARATGRVSVTGRPDGRIPVVVRDGRTVVHSEVVTVSCDA